jgi:hypothetical protein
MLTPSQIAQLKSELLTDPQALGWPALVAKSEGGTSAGGSQDATIAGLISSASGPGAAVLNLLTSTKATFLLAIAPAFLALPSLPQAIQNAWYPILNFLTGAPDDHPIDLVPGGVIQQQISQAVTLGILTQAQANAALQAQCSRSEVLFGQGVLVDQADVSLALRGH